MRVLLLFPLPPPNDTLRSPLALQDDMSSKYLYGFYGFFTLSMLVFGVISIVFSFLWRREDLLLNMIFSHGDLTGAYCPRFIRRSLFSRRRLSLAGVILGFALLFTSFLSVGAVIQRNHVTKGLVVLNWVLIMDAIFVLVVGTVVWFFSLRERAEFHTEYAKLLPSQRITIQDMVQNTIVTRTPLLLTYTRTSNSLVAVDILMRRISLRLVEAFVKIQPLLMHSTRLLRATFASHHSLTTLMNP